MTNRCSNFLADDVARIRAELDLSAPEPVVIRGVMVWSALFGAVSFEVFGQYGKTLSLTRPDCSSSIWIRT
jgi:hypothetical protein